MRKTKLKTNGDRICRLRIIYDYIVCFRLFVQFVSCVNFYLLLFKEPNIEQNCCKWPLTKIDNKKGTNQYKYWISTYSYEENKKKTLY